ncbi:undecaprenyl-diphosphate phosphatase [Longimicrobium sp.]|uniref:undecaprenyl-diphosphate phosphatase n=1 Tax=Longimicrobium sp. TaxID=2029185 RepID=UPI002BC2A19F|nr:undecaprenyl-diphosphate phosphatase [Longimicrobium sp.]HSU14529.1 undecaprenyl-diphosphate phosphatase [Longimicrobium sp.]
MDPILLAKAAVMGLVEGATEFIPVSSTGHLIIAGRFLGFDAWHGAKTFDVFIQLGAILAVVWLYRAKIVNVLRTAPGDRKSRRLILNLVIAFLPAAIVGFLANDFIEEKLFNPVTVAIALVAGGIVILLIEGWHRRVRTETVDDVTPKEALGVGLAQLLALVPGTSRSGATIMGGIGLGLSRVAATEFSFFLAIPVMFAATLYSLWKARHGLSAADAPVFAVGFVVSFVSALLVIRWLLRFVANNSFRGFAWYRIVFGLILLGLYFTVLRG